MAESDARNQDDVATAGKEFDRIVAMNIHQRLHAVRCAVGGMIEKDKEFSMGKGGNAAKIPYVSHDAVTMHIRNALNTYRVDVSPSVKEHTKDGNRTEMLVDVSFINIDRPDDYTSVCALGYGVDPSDKGPGKAFSYALKYAYLKRFVMAAGEDIEEQNLGHDPDKVRASQELALKDESRDALLAWAENFKAALNNAPSTEAIDELMKANAAALKKAPEATCSYFVEISQNRKAAMEPHPLEAG